MTKTALITGSAGQDGSYLAEYLLSLGYEVHCMTRQRSDGKIDPRLKKAADMGAKIFIGDVCDRASIDPVMASVKPLECYHLAAMSHVGVSFANPGLAIRATVDGTLNVLESVRTLSPATRVYFAATSEMFGGEPGSAPQNEGSRMSPKSPYAIAKLAAYQLCGMYRDSYDVFVSRGILFNHESPRRGVDFVTRKLSRAAAEVAAGVRERVELGNMESMRDWGDAREYVKAMHAMLQLENPDDFVLGSGIMHTVEEFADAAFRAAGIELAWEMDPYGMRRGVDEGGVVRVLSNPNLFRPNECRVLCADPTKAKHALGFDAGDNAFERLVADMVRADVDEVARELRAAA
jgi:GDPmannose 4,6-dehydratase